MEQQSLLPTSSNHNSNNSDEGPGGGDGGKLAEVTGGSSDVQYTNSAPSSGLGGMGTSPSTSSSNAAQQTQQQVQSGVSMSVGDPVSAAFMVGSNASGNNQQDSTTAGVVDSNWTALPNTPPVEMKLFVGRVPRTADESVLRPLFAEFGVVTEIAIIKDRTTNVHKGSAFVRMASITQADASIRVLNGQKVLDPQLGPLQVRYATGEAEKLGMTPESSAPGNDQAKLFVGSLPKNATEEEVRNIFGRLGQIDEVFIMKDVTTGHGKGCAFVKFAYKEQAINAIKQISGQHQMPGAPRPLEVRFAESKRAGTTVPTGATQSPGQTFAPQGLTANPALRARVSSTTTGAMMTQPMLNAGATGHYGVTTPAAANSNPRQFGPWKEYFADDGRPYYHNEQTNQTQWERPADFDRQEVTGPLGANIFVFHVPNDWTQQDLFQNFQGFGPIVSARIATDKVTGRNKGYAFVSYANLQSAAQAVQHMNGFMAGSKRLKVSIKQHEEAYVQHLLNNSVAGAGPVNLPHHVPSMTGSTTATVPSMQGYRMPGVAPGYGQTSGSEYATADPLGQGAGGYIATRYGTAAGNGLGNPAGPIIGGGAGVTSSHRTTPHPGMYSTLTASSVAAAAAAAHRKMFV